MKTYDVFLCHSTRHDADTATENTMAMVYVLLKDQGVRLFWDRKSLSAGEPLILTLSKAISASRLLVTFLSPMAAESSWVEFECEHARLNAVPIRAVLRKERPRWNPVLG
jgi:hypothetical protein